MDIIREDFFHFLWKNLHFSQNNLITTTGIRLKILHPGYYNKGDGPDYRYAKIRFNDILMVGDVELHKYSGEWNRHGHQNDSRYECVILHVVVHDNLHKREVRASDGHGVPTLELRSSLPTRLANLWRAYHRPVDLPCSGLLQEIPEYIFMEITKKWDRAYFHYRLDRILSLFPAGKPMKTAWKHMLISGVFQGLGYHHNQENMLLLADYLLSTCTPSQYSGPTSSHNLGKQLLRKAGFSGSTHLKINKKHHKAYKTGSKTEAGTIIYRSEWDFSGSRPANRPQIRIMQGAELFMRINQLPVSEWMKQPVEDQWTQICRMSRAPSIGKNRREIIFHNIILPSVYLLGQWMNHKNLCSRIAFLWARQHIPLPDKVHMKLNSSGIPSGKHYFRLATLHHYKHYCREKRCNECEVMKYLARP
ncbi:MAG: DUF2851 family protein [Balneolales bacterium]